MSIRNPDKFLGGYFMTSGWLFSICIVYMGSWLFCASCTKNKKEQLIDDLKSVVQSNWDAIEAEDLKKSRETLHHQSPDFKKSMGRYKNLFSNFDFSFELLLFDYIGEKKPYHFARIKLKTISKDKNGKDIKELHDYIQVFRKEGSNWKQWKTLDLERKKI